MNSLSDRQAPLDRILAFAGMFAFGLIVLVVLLGVML